MSQLKKKIKIAYYLTLGIFDSLYKRNKKGDSQKKGEKLLVNVGALGDMIIFLANILKFSGNQKISILIDKKFQFLFSNVENIESIYTVDSKKYSRNISYRFKTNQLMSKIFFTEVYNCKGARMYNYEDGLIHFLNADKKIALMHDLGLKKKFLKIINKNIYDKIINYNYEIIHELRRTHYIFNEIFKTEENEDIFLLNIYFQEIIKNSRLSYEYILINIGAGNEKRCWNINNFIELGNNISKNTHYKVVYCGLEQDRKKLINSNVEINEDSLNLCGKTNVSELINLICHSSLVISNDSASIHIATYLNKKSICLKSKASEGLFVPYPEKLKLKNQKTISKNKLSNISVAEVENLFKSVINS